MSQFSPISLELKLQDTNITPGSTNSTNATNGSKINGNAAVNNTQDGASLIANYNNTLYEAAGLTTSTNQNIVNNYVEKSSQNRTPLDVEVPSTTTNSGAGKSSNDSPQEASDEAKAQQGLGGTSTDQFPANLAEAAEQGAYMELIFEEYNRESAQEAGTKNKRSTFYLPLPENFNVDFNVSYDSIDTGATGMIKAQMQDAASKMGPEANGLDIAAAVTTALGKGAVNMGTRAAYAAIDAAEATAGGFVGGAAGASGEIQKLLGQIPNPHPSVFFKGLPLRQFQFAWNLVPLDEKDAKNLKDILDKMKKLILPGITAGDNSYLKYPATVQISIQGKGKDRYTNFLPCFVENMSINYTGEGTAAFFKDGAPVSTRLTMQLRESELFTREKV